MSRRIFPNLSAHSESKDKNTFKPQNIVNPFFQCLNNNDKDKNPNFTASLKENRIISNIFDQKSSDQEKDSYNSKYNHSDEENEEYGNDLFNLFYNTPKNEIGRNNEKSSSNIVKCNHPKYYTSFCTSNSQNDGGLMCYECLYKYHQDHISQCVPIRKNSFYLYLKYYKKCINNFRKKLQYLFGRMSYILSEYESEEIDDFSTLLEKKLNLNFDLPINIPFLDRLEIAVNRKLTSVFRRELSKIEKDLLNLFKNNLDKLSLFNENPNDFETIKFKSSVDFNLSGIGVVMMDSEDSDSINVKLFKGNKLIEDKIYFTEYDEEKKIKIVFLSLIL